MDFIQKNAERNITGYILLWRKVIHYNKLYSYLVTLKYNIAIT